MDHDPPSDWSGRLVKFSHMKFSTQKGKKDYVVCTLFLLLHYQTFFMDDSEQFSLMFNILFLQLNIFFWFIRTLILVGCKIDDW